MTVDLRGGAAVVTGSASGIGLGLVLACLDRGMRVAMSDLDEDRLQAAVNELRSSGGEVFGAVVDVRDESQLDALRDRALSEFGHLDLVANNAGIALVKPLNECTREDWDLILDINVKGVAMGLRSFLPALLEQGHGHVTATASLSGLAGDPGLGAYNASKFAVVGMMEALAMELTGSGVSASVLCPGPVATALLDTSSSQTGAAVDSEVQAYLERGLEPEAVGEIALAGIEEGRHFLLSHPDLTARIVGGRTEAMLDGGRLYIDGVSWTDQ